jgi:hypothetical protein
MADVMSGSTTDHIAVFPSATLRPLPGFVFEVPIGWVLDEAPPAVAMLRTLERIDDFWPNVVVNCERVPAGLELRDAADAAFARLREQHPDLEVRAEKLGSIHGQPMYLRSLDVVSPEGRALSQIRAMFLAPRSGEGNTADLFEIVGTCTTPTVDVVGPAIVSVLTSFRFS